MKTEGLSQQEIDDFIKSAEYIECSHEDYDESGNYWLTYIYKKDNKLFSIGCHTPSSGRPATPCRRIPYKRDEAPVYDIHEVRERNVTITTTVYESVDVEQVEEKIDLPWTEVKVEFEVDNDGDVYNYLKKHPNDLPAGWEAEGYILTLHTHTIKFIVNGVPTLEDGEKVREILDKISSEKVEL